MGNTLFGFGAWAWLKYPLDVAMVGAISLVVDEKDFVFKAVFENSFDTIIEFLTAMREIGIKPEHECFDSGHVANLDPLIDMELLAEPVNVSLVIGVNGGSVI